MKLTKTEQALIARAQLSFRKQGCVMTGYRTGTKRGVYGGRESSALGKLVKAGLARIVRRDHHRDCGPRFSDHWTETTYELTA
jgi:hypothetical protein